MSEHTEHGHGGEQFDTEIDVRNIGAFLVWMAVGIIVTGVLMYALYQQLKSAEVKRDAPASPLVDRSVHRMPPPPLLQTRPHPDLAAYQAAERQATQSYGWVDEAQGVIHIPVDRAMEMVVEQGLPWKPSSYTERAAAAAAPAAGAAPAPEEPAHGGGHH